MPLGTHTDAEGSLSICKDTHQAFSALHFKCICVSRLLDIHSNISTIRIQISYKILKFTKFVVWT